ncbi:MAG: hypothetical protein JNM27_23360 [Leptospirales bacterium]|nr:hypothetical protein [Leptospirales bacterium]
MILLPLMRWFIFSVGILVLSVCMNVNCNGYAQSVEAEIFESPVDEQLILSRQNYEKTTFGTEQAQGRYNTLRMGNTVLMQRSGRKRLYDHNLFLRALFQGRIVHKQYGDLRKIFVKPVMIDFGSAILQGEGAPTVRDLFEDSAVYSHLGDLLATDIDDHRSPDTEFITIYKKQSQQLPFKVLEIDMCMKEPAQISRLKKEAAVSQGTPLILRSANSGPDLFYSVDEMKQHFKSIAAANADSDVLYFFNKFILYKHMGSRRFEKLGEIDENVGLARGTDFWMWINWELRSLEQGFTPNQAYVFIRNPE